MNQFRIYNLTNTRTHSAALKQDYLIQLQLHSIPEAVLSSFNVFALGVMFTAMMSFTVDPITIIFALFVTFKSFRVFVSSLTKPVADYDISCGVCPGALLGIYSI